MVDITITDKQMSRAVVHTNQFEDGVNVLRFTLEDYVQGSTDLRNFNAYVLTSLSGSINITQIPYTVSGRVMTLTWKIDSFTLRNPGVIQYQIRFSERAEDGTAVWCSCKGVLVNRLTINADDHVSANYPTLLKQHEDLIQTLSGSFGAEIVYMAAGESIPVERRVSGRLYYQWMETPSTRATCATGKLNLGSRPYADSGLYINGVHIFIDDTADTAFAIEAATWIDAINAANCGVIATDISTNEDITILLTAAKAGSAGNSITLLLGQALYGACAYTSNPSKGTVSGITLVGGSDQQAGVKFPTGRFEDAHGNILGYSRAKYISNPDLNTILEDGEYICAGSMTNNPISDNTYCVLRVTDSTSSSRVVQECYCADLGDNTVRTFVRALTSSTDVGEWRELVTDEQLESKLQELQKKIDIPFMPDYRNTVIITEYKLTTIPVDAILYVQADSTAGRTVMVSVNGTVVFTSTESNGYVSGQFLVPAGAILGIQGQCNLVYYAPLVRNL